VPCRAEHPLLMGLAERGVVINGIDYKDPPEQAAPWLKELGNPFARIGADRSGRVAIDFGVYGVPETFVIDREGRIRYKYVGPLQPRDIKESLLPMLDRLGRERERNPVVPTGGGGQ
jgi:cytochrome c biogenesis protein CcmG/thiol:disulfide interchange protein DsbE